MAKIGLIQVEIIEGQGLEQTSFAFPRLSNISAVEKSSLLPSVLPRFRKSGKKDLANLQKSITPTSPLGIITITAKTAEFIILHIFSTARANLWADIASAILPKTSLK